jgi:hypothetical protein
MKTDVSLPSVCLALVALCAAAKINAQPSDNLRAPPELRKQVFADGDYLVHRLTWFRRFMEKWENTDLYCACTRPPKPHVPPPPPASDSDLQLAINTVQRLQKRELTHIWIKTPIRSQGECFPNSAEQLMKEASDLHQRLQRFGDPIVAVKANVITVKETQNVPRAPQATQISGAIERASAAIQQLNKPAGDKTQVNIFVANDN